MPFQGPFMEKSGPLLTVGTQHPILVEHSVQMTMHLFAPFASRQSYFCHTRKGLKAQGTQ